MDLGAIEAQRAKTGEPVLAGNLQDLDEARLDLFGKAPPEPREGILIGRAVGGNEAKRQRVVGRPLDPATGEASRGIAVDEQRAGIAGW